MSKIYGIPTVTPLVPGATGGGVNGKSAYELAVSEGYEGTLTEWLESLVGPRGERGDRGPQGPTGATGADAPIDTYLPKDGSNPMTGDLSMGGNRITNLGTPVNDTDAVRKQDVRPAGWTPTALEVGARPNTWTPTAEEVGARPNTWTPTAEDVGATTPEYVKRANPYNYLDNSDFRNPVNQRGFVTEANGGYFIDRWLGYKVIVGSNGLTFNVSTDINAHIIQKIEPKLSARLVGKVVTLAAMFNDEVQTYSFVYETSGGNSGNGKGLLKQFVNGFMEIGFAIADGGTLQWMALYEGEYTAETLPEYHPKGYAHELLECRRYYQELSYNALGNGYSAGDGSAGVLIVNTGVQMRATPKLVGDKTAKIRVNGTDYDGTCTQITMNRSGNSSICELVYQGPNIPSRYAAAFYTTSAVALSAEL